MVAISQALDLTGLQVFYTTDPLLANAPVLVFYGPCQTSNSAVSASARIQTHVYTAAGLQSYARLVVSPGSPLYSAVTCLPREDQGDEICRALAFSLLKYFTELPEIVKQSWTQHSLSAPRPSAAANLFKDTHAADLARRMVPIEAADEVLHQVETAFAPQFVSHVDIDLILPRGSMTVPSHTNNDSDPQTWSDLSSDRRYGDYDALITQFGEPTFLPTSRMRRAPSRPAVLNRSPTFTRAQKENLRLEMSQLVETEQRYVDKLHDLLHNIADSFRHKSRERAPASSSPDEETLSKLFPSSLDEISRVNSAFLNAVKSNFQQTHPIATQDIETTTDSTPAPHSRIVSSDSTGVLSFAKLLLEWFPKFSTCYPAYINAHAEFGPFLKSFAANPHSSFARRVQETGEQKLMSILIEPVQRLPRYSLYIDNIVKQLPVKHPALRVLLKAKDIISDICSQDQTSGPLSRISRIKEIIPSWPDSCRPQGRFILAVDAVELQPPFDYKLPHSPTAQCLLLLFAGHLVRIRKTGDAPMTARTFMTEVENISQPSSQIATTGQDGKGNGLLFDEATPLGDNTLVETASDSVVRIIPYKTNQNEAVAAHSDARIIRTFLLRGIYEGRVARFAKEFVRAKIEGRFSETERESNKWEAYSLDADRHGLGLFTAVYEDGVVQADARGRAIGSIRVLIDPQRDSEKIKARQQGVEIVISVTTKGQGFFWLEIESATDRSTRDLTTESDFLPIFAKRLGVLLQMRHQIRNPALAVYLLQHNNSILNAIKHIAEEKPTVNGETQIKRPQSPVKLLSNLFGGKLVKDNGSTNHNKDEKPSNPLSGFPRLDPPAKSKPSPIPDPFKNQEHPECGLTIVPGDQLNSSASDPVAALETTLSCYLVAIQARKGNIVGSVVGRRGFANETDVNELYNSLLENTGNLEKAAQASIDVLFAAFEKFVQNAWKERFGPMISAAMLSDLQTQMETLNPFDYDEYAEARLSNLAPQNRRALADVISLLASLLDDMHNDGDRGALTAAITEIVISDGEPMEFIAMFDRLVENHESISSERPASQGSASRFGSLSSTTTRSTKPASISSKASSLSRRLGLGSLKKEDSRPDSPSKGSLRRLGSRKALPPDPPVEKPTLDRSKSTDLGNASASSRRPLSRDRPPVIGTPNGSRPGTAHSFEQTEVTNSSKESSPTKSSSILRKKRRSSLSDLTALQTPSTSPFWTGSASKQMEGIFHPTSRTPSPLKPAVVDTQPNRRRAFDSNKQKENTAPQTLGNLSQHQVPSTQDREASPESLGQVSLSKGILSERISSGNTPPPLKISPEKPKAPSGSSTIASDASPLKKPCVQSANKLYERLENHQKAIDGAESSLQTELMKIAEELDATKGKSSSKDANYSSKHEQGMMLNLNTRLKALETKVTHLSRNLNDHSSSLRSDLASSLQSSEKRRQALEKELQQAKAENDALYARMNDETMKVFEQVRNGNGVEALKRQMKDSLDETEKWRREAKRLKRENLGLRSRLPD